MDRRADVWALGVVLWEALAGAALWPSTSEVELLMAIREDPVTRLRHVRPEVPVELEAIVMRALEKDADRRWATARELGQAIQRWLVGRGEVVGLPEIAGLLSSPFPGGRTQKLALLDRIRSAAGLFRVVALLFHLLPSWFAPAAVIAVSIGVSALPVLAGIGRFLHRIDEPVGGLLLGRR